MKKLLLYIALSFIIQIAFGQKFIRYGNGIGLKTFYHQQNINYYLNCTDSSGRIYAIHYDTVSSGFNFGKEYAQIRLKIFNGFTWLHGKPIRLYSKNTIDAPRVLDIRHHKGSIYLAGSFDSSENNLGSGIIKYTEGIWSSSGVNLLQTFPDYFEVNHIYPFGESICITGNFDSIPGMKVNGIMIFNGSTWDPIGGNGKYGFRNLSGTSNVFFQTEIDSLYAFNKNKIKPDSIEIGENLGKKLMVFDNGEFKQVPLPYPYVAALGAYKGNLLVFPSTNLIYIRSIGYRNNGNWQTNSLPNNDSFYATNFLGSFQSDGLLYVVFQTPNAKIKIYSFDGSNILSSKEFKVADNYLNLEFRAQNDTAFLCGNFQIAGNSSFIDSFRRILGFQIKPNATLSGYCFVDKNSDGIRQVDEELLSGSKIIELNSGRMKLADAIGHYSLTFDIGGSATLTADSEIGYEPLSDIDLGILKDSFYRVDIPMKSSLKNDIGIYISSNTGNRAKQGFRTSYRIELVNYSELDQSIQFRVNHNKKVSSKQFTGFTPNFTAKDNFIHQINLNAHEKRTFHFSCIYSIDSFVLDEMSIIEALINSNDNDLHNNYGAINQRVVAAFDPNIKVSYPSDIIDVNNRIQYYIHFENLGNDTAVNVTVIDTFQTLLSLKDVVYGGTSHPNFTVNIENNCLIWHFENIMLPPRKRDSINCHGYVSFRSQLNSKAKKGDTVFNKAAIFFDYQKPVITNSAIVTFKKDNSNERIESEQFKVFPNPSAGHVEISSSRIFTGNGLELISMEGKTVFSAILDENGMIVIPEGISNGSYLLKIEGFTEVQIIQIIR